MTAAKPRTCVVTGAPGAGKTALIEELTRRGWRTVAEAARAMLREPEGMALRADCPAKFAAAMLAREEADLAAAPDDGHWTVFDRGVGDTLGFLRLSAIAPDDAFLRRCAALRYSGPVFVAPAWREIFCADPERIQTWDEAVSSGVAVMEAWRELGYGLVELPLTSVAERADFVATRLGG